jgi:hypothetical protein
VIGAAAAEGANTAVTSASTNSEHSVISFFFMLHPLSLLDV